MLPTSEQLARVGLAWYQSDTESDYRFPEYRVIYDKIAAYLGKSVRDPLTDEDIEKLLDQFVARGQKRDEVAKTLRPALKPFVGKPIGQIDLTRQWISHTTFAWLFANNPIRDAVTQVPNVLNFLTNPMQWIALALLVGGAGLMLVAFMRLAT